MSNRSVDWNSFWDVCSPQQAARALIAEYGAAASEAVTECTTAAQADQREEDVRFWNAVMMELRGIQDDEDGREETADRVQSTGRL